MPFNLYCDKKGCKQFIEPVIDPKTNCCYCTCEKQHEITQLSEFAKRQLASLGQTINKVKKKKSFSVKCASCNRESTPVLKAEERDAQGQLVAPTLHCTFCDVEQTHLSPPFAQMLRDFLIAQKRAKQ